MMSRWINFLFKPINPTIVSLFRIFFGGFMVYQMVMYYQLNFTFNFISGPELLFPVAGLSFLKPLPIIILKFIHGGMLVSAILITLGLWYRYAMSFFFLGFFYFTFIDATLYNNHLYLIVMIAFFMIFIQADIKYSLKAYFSKKKLPNFIPAWNQYILGFLIALPYFFGGIAKLSSHWLDGSVSKIVVEGSRNDFIYTLIPKDIAPLLFTYTGVIYDLVIVFLLINKYTRWFGVVCVLIFNIVNGTQLFSDIGLFPWLMICSTILFFNSEKVGNFFDKKFLKYKNVSEKFLDSKNKNNTVTSKQKITAVLILCFIIVQLFLPFRYHIFTNNPEWTGICSRYSWRMKMHSKAITKFDMRMIDRERGDTLNIQGKTFLTTNQYLHIADDPRNFLHLANYLEKVVEKKYKVKNPIFHADVQVSFNGREPQNMFSPTLNLLDEKAVSGNSWIIPLKKD